MLTSSRKVSSLSRDAKLLLSNISRKYVDTMTHQCYLTRVNELEFCIYRQLRDGTLEENGLQDGSRVILLPSVETGLLVSASRCVETPQVLLDNHVFHNNCKLINKYL